MFKFGIIGAGMVAKMHLDWIKTEGRGEVIAICDTNKESADKLAIEYDIENIYDDYKELLEKEEVDGVIIATPPFTHTDILLEAVKSNKNVLLEKPICINRKELDEIREVVSQAKHLKIMDCSARHSRLQAKFQVVKDLILSGKLGQIYSINHISLARQGRAGVEYNPNSKWFLNKKLALGGPLADWGMYDLSFHLGILSDKPILKNVNSLLVTGLDNVPYGDAIFDVEEHFIANLEFDDGLLYHYERASNVHNVFKNETRICGTKGGLKFSYLSWENPKIEYFFVDDNGKGKAKTLEIEVDNTKFRHDGVELIAHYIDYVKNDIEPILPFMQSLKNMDIIFNILENARIIDNRNKGV